MKKEEIAKMLENVDEITETLVKEQKKKREDKGWSDKPFVSVLSNGARFVGHRDYAVIFQQLISGEYFQNLESENPDIIVQATEIKQ